MRENAKGILFDLDGTLLDTHDLLLATFQYATKRVLDQDIPAERLMAKVGQPLDVQMWDFTDDQAVHDELTRTYREHNAVIHDDMVRLFPGVRETVAALREAGLRTAVVTSKRHGPAMHGLELFDVAGLFDFVVGSDDWPEFKPSPGPVKRGCDLLGLPPEACVYVGDSPFDMQAGNGAGCMTVAALWGMFPEDVLRAERPDFVCGKMADLLEVLDV